MRVDVSSAAEAAHYAVMDLATKLGIPASDITVAEKGGATWPDTSLGMPEPGMMYAQMLTEGFRVVLLVDRKMYEYHFGNGSVTMRSL